MVVSWGVGVGMGVASAGWACRPVLLIVWANAIVVEVGIDGMGCEEGWNGRDEIRK